VYSGVPGGYIAGLATYCAKAANMPNVAILAVKGCYLSCAAGFADVLQVANVHLRQQQGSGARRFEWCFVSPGGAPVVTSNGIEIQTRPLDAFPAADIVLIPAIHYPGFKPFVRFLNQQAETCSWLRAQWKAGAWIGANCTGTFLLAQSGLLDGRTATTTWWLSKQFRTLYPKIDLQFRSVLTESERLVCAGATATYLLQVIRLIEQFMGPAIASQSARSMLIDISHSSHVPYVPLLTETSHTDSVVERAQQWLQKNMAGDVSMSDLARAVAVSERTLARRFTLATGQTPHGYLQAVRLQAARALLEIGDMPVQSVAVQVGYNDVSSFTRLFKDAVGLTPGAYRGRFQLPSRRSSQ
jgi:transcriptional regulator GlxA family with amidase domain